MDNHKLILTDDDKNLKKLQKVQLEMLVEFNRICKQNNINYQLFAGTLLGAVRHNGFIPWDDDIDVCMLRKDYDKFIEVSKENLNKKYFLQTVKTDKEFIYHFAKIRKNNTLFIQDDVASSDIHHGIYIDVFPLDNTKPDFLSGKFQRFSLNIMKKIGESRNKERCLSAKNIFNKYLRLTIYYLLKLFPKKFMDKLIEKILRMFNDEYTDYVGDLTLSTDKNFYKRFTLERQIFENSINWKFENYIFPIPQDYDYVLSKNYGDYMTLPTLEEQKSKHDIVEINFDVALKK